MADWTAISSFATGGGTLVLAVATFSAVRSANRSAQTAERTLQASLRPFLIHARIEDPDEKIMWGDEHWAHVGAGKSVVEAVGEAIYLAMPLRNAGSGLAVLHGWHIWPARMPGLEPHIDPADFHPQFRDLYVPAGDTGFWQASLRNLEADLPSLAGTAQLAQRQDDDELRAQLAETIANRNLFSIDLLYSDSEGGQRTISRFSLSPRSEGVWSAAVTKHWNLDRPDPR